MRIRTCGLRCRPAFGILFPAEPLKWVKPPELKLSETARIWVFEDLKCRV